MPFLSQLDHGTTPLDRVLSAARSLGGCALVLCAMSAPLRAQLPGAWQSAPATPASGHAILPEPVHWKQNLFLIPYQWSSVGDPSAAEVVWLYVSKDAGASWQKISEAKPHVKAFNYRAEADGEYWFAIRTLDHSGQARPSGPMQPELRVVVDTTMPHVEDLHAALRDDGTLDIQWRATDRNLDPNSWHIEVQTDASDDWQPVTILHTLPTDAGIGVGQATWSPPAGSRPVAVRATVADRAGNPAFYQTAINASSLGYIARTPRPAPADLPNHLPADLAVADAPPNGSGWTPGSAPTTGSDRPGATESQPWPADVAARRPFRLANTSGGLTANPATTYGTPAGVGERFSFDVPDRPALGESSDLVPVDDPAGPAGAGADQQLFAPRDRPQYTPLEPFREASISRPANGTTAAAPDSPPVTRLPAPEPPDAWRDHEADAPQPNATVPQHAAARQDVAPKMVNSRTFALDYEVDDVGGWGVSKVQLWGTRDGGQTWYFYAQDDDHQSPLRVTVDGEGLYGFRIVVQSAGGPGGFAPQPGDRPELWVGVDLHRPQAEIISVDQGSGNLRDHLIIRWRASDDNLQPRPISLFFSSRPAGPWTAVATALENSGQYAWRIDRYVPARFYLRLEARDTADNLAAYQTVDPISFDRPQPTGSLRNLHAVSQ